MDHHVCEKPNQQLMKSAPLWQSGSSWTCFTQIYPKTPSHCCRCSYFSAWSIWTSSGFNESADGDVAPNLQSAQWQWFRGCSKDLVLRFCHFHYFFPACQFSVTTSLQPREICSHSHHQRTLHWTVRGTRSVHWGLYTVFTCQGLVNTSHRYTHMYIYMTFNCIMDGEQRNVSERESSISCGFL